jgi:anti-anti-sigma regulatory factor
MQQLDTWPPLPIDEAGRCTTAIPRELVVANRQQLKLQLLEAIERGARTITLELAETVYIDSSGFGALINVG